uniref:Uncharacterized protein n=1 Tax=viral metagenome TaxID=1070528 RepID=A0A6M3L1W9_9ZZZZ
MVNWDDLAVRLNKASDSFERAIKAFESLTKTYDELIDYCKKIQESK